MHALSAVAARRAAGELALFAAAGVVMAMLGPYETYRLPTSLRLVYWTACLVGGGTIGIAVDAALVRAVPKATWRVLASAVAMTTPVTVFVFAIGMPLGFQTPTRGGFSMLLWQVFVISLPIMAIRALTRRGPQTIVETRTVVEAPLPEAEAAFRRRLSAKRRFARLIAVEAEDHYLRVHTDGGDELLTMRFGDALAELSRANGLQVHRSWWVAADAIEGVAWRRGGGELRLQGELSAPVSRTYAPGVKAAGWH